MGIHESDMLAVPDAGTACIDPFFAKPTIRRAWTRRSGAERRRRLKAFDRSR
jgi:glutamine synthetase